MQLERQITIAAAGNYAAGAVISGDADNGEGAAWEFTFPEGAYAQSEGVITHGVATFSVDALVPRLYMDVFKANPSASELDDNAAATIALADRLKYLGTVKFEPLSDRGELSGAESFPYIPYSLDPGESLYGIVRTLDAFTNESAGMTGTFVLSAERS